jgi:hypothetical protein
MIDANSAVTEMYCPDKDTKFTQRSREPYPTLLKFQTVELFWVQICK